MSPSPENPASNEGAPALLTREILSRASKEQLIDIVLLLQQQVLELREENAVLRAENAALREENAALRARVEKLERRLGMNSSNSSKPPSSDPPGTKKARRKKKKKSKRKRGAQPGHEPHHRSLIPVDEVYSLVKNIPPCCDKCSSTSLVIDFDNPHRHQFWEIPPVEPIVRENQQFEATCNDCGCVTRAELPVGVPPGSFGPRVQAIVSYLTGAGRLSKRLVKSMMKDLFGLAMCIGSVSNCEKAVSQALEDPVEEAHQYVQGCNVIYADETSWWQQFVRFWLWVAVTSVVTVFMIDRHRSREAALKLLGSFKGILVTDRWKPYRIHTGLRQFCWAHYADIRIMPTFCRRPALPAVIAAMGLA